jgi:hypothetical protein
MYKVRMNKYVKLVLLINVEINVAKSCKTLITESQNNDNTSKNIDENSTKLCQAYCVQRYF